MWRSSGAAVATADGRTAAAPSRREIQDPYLREYFASREPE